MPSRRVLLQALGIGAVASTTVGASTAMAATSSGEHRWSSDVAPWWLLSPFRAGSSVGLGWRIDHLSVVENGACVLTLSSRSGSLARVHICAREGRPRGLAYSALFDLVLMDGGQGDQQTEESLGRVLRQLARHVRKAEQKVGEAELRTVVGLRSHTDRVARYGAEALV